MNEMYPPSPVLWVDDERHFLDSIGFLLAAEGITNFIPCQDSRETLRYLKEQECAVVVLDMNMPYLSGQELLPRIVGEFPGLPVIIATAINDLETAVGCMKSGAFDYIVKPIDDVMLVATLRRAIQYWDVRNENRLLKKHFLSGHLEHPEAFAGIITCDFALRTIFQYMEAIAGSPLPVLITGETGVGKELIAGVLHALSRRKGAFVAVNTSGVDDHLFSDTLFGHVKGGFTGAERERRGLIEQAQGGTIFLDEIGDLSTTSQVKLLRLLQDGTYYPIGSDIQKTSSARVLVATNHDLENLMQAGAFRRDLFYRLQTHHIHIPPLRERKDDLPLLVEYFLNKAAVILEKKRPTPPPQLVPLLSTYHFPGNVRELESLIFHAVSTHTGGVLSLNALCEKMPTLKSAQAPAPIRDPGASARFPDPLPTLKQTERELIAEALRRAGNNQTLAARLLGLSRRALNNRLVREKAGKE